MHKAWITQGLGWQFLSGKVLLSESYVGLMILLSLLSCGHFICCFSLILVAVGFAFAAQQNKNPSSSMGSWWSSLQQGTTSLSRVLYSKEKSQPFENLFHPSAGNSWEMLEHCLRHFYNIMHSSTNDGGVKISSTVASPHWFILNFTNFWSHQGYMCSHCILVASCTSSANIDMYSIFTSIWNRILTSSLIQCNF